MLGIENERCMHDLHMQRIGRLAMEQMQEMPANALFITGGIDAHTLVAVAIPVRNDGREGRQHPVNMMILLAEIRLGLEIAQHRAARAHDIHWMGIGRNLLEHRTKRRRQFTQGFQALAIGFELGLCRQMTINQQMSNFFKLGVLGQIMNIIASIGQPGAGLPDRTQCCLTCGDAPQSRGILCHISPSWPRTAVRSVGFVNGALVHRQRGLMNRL